MSDLSALRSLALADSRKRHPGFPSYATSIKSYNDRSANGLTRCIIDFLTFSGHQAERISVTGRPLDRTKIVKDVLGSSRRIGSMKWLPGTMTKGSADISSTIKNKDGIGISVKIEVKMRDRQSTDQKSYQLKIEAAGGFYWLVRSFDEFMNFYNTMQK